MPKTVERTWIKTTCPRDCYDACGLLVAKDDGRVRKVLGDPDHAIARGALCGKCAIAYNGVFRDPEARLMSPLKRVGPKGSGEFAEIGWDEAFETISSRITPLIDSGDNAKILHTHYTGTVALISGWFPIRFFNHIGATEVDPDTVCNKAGHEALTYMFGDSLDGFDPATAVDSKVIVVWGANPSHAAPHQHKHWLGPSEATVIAIDPIAHDTATAADIHLQLRPGSDAALAFGLLHVAKREGLLDRAYIDANAIGFDLMESEIDRATPEWTEAKTGVPAADIERVGVLFAEGPSLLWLGQGMQRQPRGGNAFRAAATVAVATGNIGKPGAGFCYMNGPGSRGIDMDTVVPPGPGDAPSISHMDLADTLLDPAQSQVLFTWNNNILASSPNQATLRSALTREDLFQVTVDLFATDTVDFADIVLPAASFLEFDDLIASYFDHTLSAQVQVMEPLGASLPNQEIFRRLATHMGFTDPELLETDEALLDRLVAQTPFSGGFRDLAAVGTVKVLDAPRMQFPDGAFATPSGKIEIACERLKEMGLPLVPEPHADTLPDNGRIRILSPASRWQMNSSYGNDAGIRNKLGGPSVLVHPDDAATLGVTDGANVTVSNDEGALSATVQLSDAAQPGMAVIYKGRWPRFDGSHANVNVLNPGDKTDLAESSCVHAVEANIRLAEAAE
jgi:anaerobic selenocysteine-containing dehydrogenase